MREVTFIAIYLNYFQLYNCKETAFCIFEFLNNGYSTFYRSELRIKHSRFVFDIIQSLDQPISNNLFMLLTCDHMKICQFSLTYMPFDRAKLFFSNASGPTNAITLIDMIAEVSLSDDNAILHHLCCQPEGTIRFGIISEQHIIIKSI